MFARVTTGTGSPERIDETVRIYQEQMVPTLRQQQGFQNAIFVADRSSGKGISITLWDSEEAARAAEAQAQQMRAQARESMQIRETPTVELYEVAVADGDGVGAFTRATRVEGTPDRLEEGIRTFREQTVPTLQGQAGYKGAYLLVDRQSGKAISFSVWESEEAMRQSEQAITQQRTQITQQMGASTPQVEQYEVLVQV